MVDPPGTKRPRRFRPKLRWELIGCGLHGHELLGTDAAHIRQQDRLFADEREGLRWYRCLRCDSWLPLPPPVQPTRQHPLDKSEVAVPLRGRPLRDRFVLRAIAIDRIFHFLAITALGVAVLLFAQHRASLHADYTRILNRLQGVAGGPFSDTQKSGLFKDLNRLFDLSSAKLHLYGVLFIVYGVVNGIEAFGLWWAKRWAEYLTFIEVLVLLPLTIHELTVRVSALKIIAMILNLVIIAYLLFTHRLFGVRGGGKADRAERERDTGWAAVERTSVVAVEPTPPGGDHAALGSLSE